MLGLSLPFRSYRYFKISSGLTAFGAKELGKCPRNCGVWLLKPRAQLTRGLHGASGKVLPSANVMAKGFPFLPPLL